MSQWERIGSIGVAAVALMMGACSASYDCSNGDVTDALIAEAATSGYVGHMKEVPADWKSKLTDHTTARSIVTLDENRDIGHFRCRANLEYSDGNRTVTSKEITYDVRKVEGESNFTLEWEVETNGISDIDPIHLFAMDVQDPWKGELEQRQLSEYRSKVAAEKDAARTWAHAYAPEYAAKNPPIPFDRDALKKYATDDLSYKGKVEFVTEQFGDIDGDGFLDYFAIFSKAEFDEGQFAEETDNYKVKNTGGFMRMRYFYEAVTQPFAGFGLKTTMQIHEGPVTIVEGEKVTETYLPKEISNMAKPPENSIAGVSSEDGYVVIALTDGQSVTIKDFKPEKPLAQMQQDRMEDLENRLARAKEAGGDLDRLLSRLYE